MGQWRPQWTPGPWTFGRTSGQWVIVPEGGMDVIARVIAGELDFTRRAGNARLISAAPDLYDALEHAFARMPSKDPAWQACLNETYAALKKAGMSE